MASVIRPAAIRRAYAADVAAISQGSECQLRFQAGSGRPLAIGQSKNVDTRLPLLCAKVWERQQI